MWILRYTLTISPRSFKIRCELYTLPSMSDRSWNPPSDIHRASLFASSGDFWILFLALQILLPLYRAKFLPSCRYSECLYESPSCSAMYAKHSIFDNGWVTCTTMQCSAWSVHTRQAQHLRIALFGAFSQPLALIVILIYIWCGTELAQCYNVAWTSFVVHGARFCKNYLFWLKYSKYLWFKHYHGSYSWGDNFKIFFAFCDRSAPVKVRSYVLE